jgi:hypothetical protein
MVGSGIGTAAKTPLGIRVQRSCKECGLIGIFNHAAEIHTGNSTAYVLNFAGPSGD